MEAFMKRPIFFASVLLLSALAHSQQAHLSEATIYREGEACIDSTNYKYMGSYGEIGSSGGAHMTSTGPGARLVWDVSIPTAGNYYFALRWMNGSTTGERSGTITIGDGAAVAVPFPMNTVGWDGTGWDTTELAQTVELAAGTVRVTLNTTTKGPWVDWIAFTSAATTPLRQPAALAQLPSGQRPTVRLDNGVLSITASQPLWDGVIVTAAGKRVAKIGSLAAGQTTTITLHGHTEGRAGGFYILQGRTTQGSFSTPLIQVNQK
jgi:hypothetical protein